MSFAIRNTNASVTALVTSGLTAIFNAAQLRGTTVGYFTSAEIPDSNVLTWDATRQEWVYGPGHVDPSEIVLEDGTVSNPSLRFINDADTGLYRGADNTLSVAAGGLNRLNVNTTGASVDGIVSATTVRAGNGLVSAPSYAFEDDTDTGIYRTVDNTLSIAAGGLNRFNVDTTGASVDGTVSATNALMEDGLVSLPAYSFANDTDTGIYRAGDNTLSITAGGLNRFNVNTTGASVDGVVSATSASMGNGLATAPSYTFTSDPDTGMFRAGNNTMAFATDGTNRMQISTSFILVNVRFIQIQGTAAMPSYAFTNASSSGLYAPAANTVGVSAGGALRLSVSNTAITAELPTTVNANILQPAGAETRILQAVSSATLNSTNELKRTRIEYDTGNAGSTVYTLEVGDSSVADSGVGFVPNPPVGAFNSTVQAGDALIVTRRPNNSVMNILCFATIPCGIRLRAPSATEATIVIRCGLINLTLSDNGVTQSVTLNTSLTLTGDLILIGNLSITGNFAAGNGLVSAPAYSFGSQTDTGMYRVGPSTLGFATGGVNRFQIGSSFIQASLRIFEEQGTAAAPSYAFSAATTSGLYSPAANTVGVSAGGVLRLTVSNTAITADLPMTANADINQPAGNMIINQDISEATLEINNQLKRTTIRYDTGGSRSASQALRIIDAGDSGRGFGFVPNATNGAYSPLTVAGDSLLLTTVKGNGAFNIIAWAEVPCGTRYHTPSETAATVITRCGLINFTMSDNGVTQSVTLNTSLTLTGDLNLTGNLNITGNFASGDGLVTAPAYTFASETDTGMYRAGASTLGFATGGVNRFQIGSTSMSASLRLLEEQGTAAAPSYSFSTATTSGLYSPAANSVGVSAGGVLRLTVSDTAITLALPTTINADLMIPGTGSRITQFTIPASINTANILKTTTIHYNTGATGSQVLCLTVTDTSVPSSGMGIVPNCTGGSFNSTVQEGDVVIVTRVANNSVLHLLCFANIPCGIRLRTPSSTEASIVHRCGLINLSMIDNGVIQSVSLNTAFTLSADLVQPVGTMFINQGISNATIGINNQLKRTTIRYDTGGTGNAVYALSVLDSSASNRGFGFVPNATNGAYSPLTVANDSLLLTTVKGNSAFNIICWAAVPVGTRYHTPTDTSGTITTRCGVINFTMSDNGVTSSVTLNHDLDVTGAVNSTNLTSGNYTPTITGTTNITSTTLAMAQFQRNNNIVTFSMRGTVDCTNPAVASVFTVSLPVARTAGNFNSTVLGNATVSIFAGTDATAGFGRSVDTTQTMEILFTSLTAGANGFSISGSYSLVN